MKLIHGLVFAAVTVLLPAVPIFAATIDFESVPLNTVYGGAANDALHDIVLVQDGIAMSVEEFFTGDFQAFYRAEVGHGQEFFPTTPLGLNNISVRFGFDDVGFAVNHAAVEFLEFGGAINFAVNDQPILQLSSLANVPSNIAPAVLASVEGNMVVLNGSLQSFQIGGAELVIDNVFAVPEPSIAVLLSVGAFAVACVRRAKFRRTSNSTGDHR